jgi:CRP-like cAMP-binding protein
MHAGRLQNRLLAALPGAEWQRWRAQLDLVMLPRGRVLAEPRVACRHVCFPTTAVVSLLYVTENGHSTEVAVIGNEGLVGIATLMGDGSTPQRAVVQVAGQAYRLSADFIRDEFARSGPVRRLLLSYTQAKMVQIGQTAVCNRLHSLDQRLCRWLLLTIDRLPGDTFAMTHERIADNLGVRREGVTTAARKLQAAGLIHYTHGHFSVLDRGGLERCACECYSVVKLEYARLLPEERVALPAVGARLQRAVLRDVDVACAA